MRSLILAALVAVLVTPAYAADLLQTKVDLNGVDLKGCPNFTVEEALTNKTLTCADGSTVGFVPFRSPDGSITVRLERRGGSNYKCVRFNGKNICDNSSSDSTSVTTADVAPTYDPPPVAYAPARSYCGWGYVGFRRAWVCAPAYPPAIVAFGFVAHPTWGRRVFRSYHGWHRY